MEQVSVVMPTYNCADFIAQSIASVCAQTYKNWELLIVDDCSSDNTEEIVSALSETDERIIYIRLETNSGAAAARNKGIEMARGSYIAFLDSDDLWYPDKLKKQLDFMKKNNSCLSCTAYEYINEDGAPVSKVIKPFKRADYNMCLYFGNCIGNSTAMYDVRPYGKFFVPQILKRNDFALWLQILKKEKYVYGLQDVTVSYRNRSQSLSKNKFGLLKFHWQLYREIEKLNFVKSVFAVFTLLISKTYKKILK